MRLPSARVAYLAAALLTAPACNALFGISDGTPEATAGGGGASSSSGHGGTGVTSTVGSGGAGVTSTVGSGGSGVTSTAGTGGTGTASSGAGTGGGGATCAMKGTATCDGSMLTICDGTGHTKPTQDCGAAALCDPAGQTCNTYRSLAAGQIRACAVDGQDVYCWGANWGSPLTLGSLVVGDSHLMFPTPTKIAGVSAVQVSVADVHQCALSPSGQVICWGYNGNAALGIPASDDYTTNTVSFASSAVEVGVASACSCARLGDTGGSVMCWGLQDNGCLGDGTMGSDGDTRATPTLVPLPAPAVQIRIGDGRNTPSCALLTSQEVYCWGAGFGPTKVLGVTSAEEIAVASSLVFIRSAGDVYVTTAVAPGGGAGGGGGADGGVDGGSPSTTFSTPVLYLNSGLVTRMAGGNSFCAVQTSGTSTQVGCQQLYNLPATLAQLDPPTPVAIPGTPVDLAVGYGDNYDSTLQCVRIANQPSNASIYCWGVDDQGELGVGGPEYPDAPATVAFTPALTSAASKLTSSSESTSVTLADGSARYWGLGNAYLPNGPEAEMPAPPLGDLGPNVALLRQSDAWSILYALKPGVAPLYLQYGSSTPGARLLGYATTNYVDVATGLMNGHTDLGLLANGQVVVYSDGFSAYGYNGDDTDLFGDGDDGATTPAGPTLELVPLPSAASALAACAPDWSDAGHACALLATGDLYCWGSNLSGESGVDTAPLLNVSTPTQVTIPGAGKIVSVATGATFTCATDGSKGTGQVYCWGSNDYGQLGDGGYSGEGNAVPTAVQGIMNNGATVAAAGLTAGDTHACAWLADGTAMCWGCNDYGQLGTGKYDDEPQATPVVTGGKLVASMSASTDHTCALYTDGTISCWGSSYYGQVGNGKNASFPTPTPVPGLP
jgi:alpha-tubulin suppressor-like RCC1 family protein